jgi:hypothetical protein
MTAPFDHIARGMCEKTRTGLIAKGNGQCGNLLLVVVVTRRYLAAMRRWVLALAKHPCVNCTEAGCHKPCLFVSTRALRRHRLERQGGCRCWPLAAFRKPPFMVFTASEGNPPAV